MRMRVGRTSCFLTERFQSEISHYKIHFHEFFLHIFEYLQSHFCILSNQTCTLYFERNITKNNQVSNAARKSHMTTRTPTHDLKQKQKYQHPAKLSK